MRGTRSPFFPLGFILLLSHAHTDAQRTCNISLGRMARTYACTYIQRRRRQIRVWYYIRGNGNQ